MGEFAQFYAKLFWHEKFGAPIPIPNPTPTLDPGSVRDLEPDLQGESGSTTSQPPLTQPLMCKIGSSVFAAMSRLKVASTTWAFLPSIPSTERKNGEKCLSCLWQCRPCLSFFICSHLGKSVSIPSFTEVPASAYPNLM